MSEPPSEPPPPPPTESGIATAPSIEVAYKPGTERLVLVGLSGPASGIELMLGSEELIIGRTRRCQLRLDDEEVSRQHARLTLVPDAQQRGRSLVLVEDLGSRNGIQVNGQATKRALLDGGEKILVGRSVLRVDRRDEIDIAHDEQRRAEAMRDPLTGLGNRQALREAVDRAEQRRQDGGGGYAVIVIDLDFFKQVNDTYGHPAGDAALQHAARTLNGALRASDAAFRMGGEEFLAILPGADRVEAHAVAERVRIAIETAPVAHEGTVFTLTASLGVAVGGPGAIEQADRALYEAKNAGRNRVCDAR